ncbi:MAG TPA: hypothetical protein VEF76_06345, partial [Patescibacteria group bacterium]|nr:hypothetical protein [Patescibacteria group bacterium]
MKKLKSLALSFALVAGGALGLSQSASAQTVTVSPTQQTELVTNNYIAEDVVNAVSQLPMNNVYYRAGRGFTTARVDQTGESVGVEYQLTGNQRQPLRAYNLDDPQGAADFSAAKLNAGATENALAQQEVRSRVYVRSYPTYVYLPPARPVILVGPVFRPSHHHHSYRHHNWAQPPVIHIR